MVNISPILGSIPIFVKRIHKLKIGCEAAVHSSYYHSISLGTGYPLNFFAGLIKSNVYKEITKMQGLEKEI